jgi:large subunit ribosomal protein L25
MPEQPTIQIEPRTGVGSAQARKVRRAGRVPAVIYGHCSAEAVSLDASNFRHQVSPAHYGSIIIRLRQGSQDAGAALVKAVQINTLNGEIIHVDFQRVSAEERVHVSVQIILLGDPPAVRAGGVLEQYVRSVNLRCRADAIPEHIEFDTTNLALGDALHAEQLAIPADCELLDKPEDVIAVMLMPTVPVEEEPTQGSHASASGPELVGEKQKEDFPSER